MLLLNDGRHTSPQKPNGCVYQKDGDEIQVLTHLGYKDYNSVVIGDLLPVHVASGYSMTLPEFSLQPDDVKRSVTWLTEWFNQVKFKQFYSQLEMLVTKADAEQVQYHLTNLGVYTEVIAPTDVKMKPNQKSKNRWVYVQWKQDITRLLNTFPTAIIEPYKNLEGCPTRNISSLDPLNPFKQFLKGWAKDVYQKLIELGIDLTNRVYDPYDEWSAYDLFIEGEYNEYADIIDRELTSPMTDSYTFYRIITENNYVVVTVTDIILSR